MLEVQATNMSSSSSTTTTRWCPTPEQLMILEEIYRRGMTTPKATQVQQITVYLSYYGKVEGKNVFYWFQNHKARERQKLRKKLMIREQQQQQQLFMQQNHHDHVQFVNHFDHSCGLMTDRFPHYNSSQVLHRQGVLEQASTHVTWRAEEPDNNETRIKIYSDDPMYATEGAPFPPPCCTRKPLKTLELFPTKSMAPSLNTSSHASLSDYK